MEPTIHIEYLENLKLVNLILTVENSYTLKL